MALEITAIIVAILTPIASFLGSFIRWKSDKKLRNQERNDGIINSVISKLNITDNLQLVEIVESVVKEENNQDLSNKINKLKRQIEKSNRKNG